MKSRNTKQIEKILRAVFATIILLSAYKCTAQDFRINTAVGMVIAYESGTPDEICISFGENSGVVAIECLGETSNTLPGRVSEAVRMADEAGVNYANFLRELECIDSPSLREYYLNCRTLRTQFLSLMPELALLEIRQITQYFQQ